jgi:septal ring factor EnvC (AmiA/AmiB activator)
MTEGYNWREVQALKEEAAELRRQLREREKADLLASIAARDAAAAARDAAQRGADQQARDAEIEAARKGAWTMYHTDPERINILAAHDFSPTWIADQTPLEGWPPGIDPSEYT